MKNEEDYKKLINCIFCHPSGIECVKEDESFLTDIAPLFSKILNPLKRPDGYIVDEQNNRLILLEHFQFDNSKKLPCGSDQAMTTSKTCKQFADLAQDYEHPVVSEYVRKSGQYYVESFSESFISHANKIDIYKQEMLTEINMSFDNILMGFVIEDASPLGSCYFDHRLNGVNLVNTKEFLDLFEQTPKLDFVIFAMKNNIGNIISSFISRKTINIHRKTQIVVSNIDKFAWETTYLA